jgi:hypothetical protein
MYFNRRVLFASAFIASPSVVKAGDCKQSFVQAASDAGFLKYALLNCIASENAVSPTNVLGEDIIDPQSCLTSFEESSGVAFSEEPIACVNRYRTFVAELADMIDLAGNASPFEDVGGHDGCSYDEANDEVTMSYVCWNRMSQYLTDFQQGAGYPILIQPCEAAFVRSVTLDDAIQTAITNTLDSVGVNAAAFSVSDWTLSGTTSDGVDHIVVGDWKKEGVYYKRNDVDLKTGMCYGAYQTLLDLLQGSGAIVITTPPLGVDSFGAFNTGPAGWGLSTLEEACKEDMTSASCANSQLITSLKSLFLSLSGYDITFAGPLCTANQITSLNSGLEPTPFQLFLKCGLMASDYPAECSVPSLAQYNTQLVATVGEECSSCFTEMLAEVALLASNETVMAVCDSPANFSSSACVVAMKDVAENYKNCTGFDLKTGELIEEVTTSSTSTTTSPTDANDATRIIMSSGVIVMVAVMTYLL